MRLIQLVPELPPMVGGVGDYAVLLSKQFDQMAIGTSFIIPHHRRLFPNVLDCQGASDVLLSSPRAESLARTLDAVRPDAVLLHFSGYGFAPRGCPIWLVEGLRRWSRRREGCRLVVMFHELSAESGVPWHSSFWLSPLQKYLARSLARLADVCVTNCAHYARILHKWRSGPDQILVVPVPSNVGEPSVVYPFAQREPIAIVFGQTGTRINVYRNLRAFMPLLEYAGIQTLEDVGPPLEVELLPSSSLPIRTHGTASAHDVSRLLSRARFGLLHLPARFLGKSGCFAAFAAHGVVCLLSGHDGSATDDVVEGEHFIGVPDLSSKFLEKENYSALAENMFRWYSCHRASDLAGQLARVLF